MCRDRAGKWKLAEIMEIRELKEAEVGEDDQPIEDPATKRFKIEANPEESKQEPAN